MAVKALNGAVTYEAQSTKQVKPEKKTVVENKEVATPEKVTAFDATTVKVGEKERQGSSGNSDEANGNQQQTANEQLKKAIEQLNKNMSHSEAIFGFHEATNRVTIKIVDKDTKEVLKEFPPEKSLDMIARVWEYAGILVDEKG